MKKTVEYVVRTTENAITHQTQTVPVVVNRREPVDLNKIGGEQPRRRA